MDKDDDLEREFQKLTEQFADDDLLHIDEEFHLDKPRLCVALVLAPMDNVEALAAVFRLTGVKVPVVKLDPWAAAYLEVNEPADPEDEMMALLVEQRPIPSPVDKVASVVSKLSPHGAVAIVSWLSEADKESFEPGISGQVTAKRYIAGAPEEDIPAGLLVSSLSLKAEDLLLGRTRPEDYQDGKDEGGWKGFFRRPRRK